ncbi:DNA polymerase alpha catalytic subunit [Euwallacea similis]|uniref:DNA polymerase alpha catalytic subunit n=1 Tax=Euwallacea similis TaxID=1736056 RepID=UPI00344C0DCA
MLSNISSKKKEKTEIGDDDNTLLLEILEEDEPSTSAKRSSVERKPFVPRRQIAQNYFKKLEVSVSKKSEIVALDENIEDVKEESLEAPSLSKNSTEDSKEILKSDSIKQSKALVKVQSEMDDDFEDMFDVNQIEQIVKQGMKEKDSNKAAAHEACNNFVPDFSSDLQETVNCEAVKDDVPILAGDKQIFRFFWWDAFEDQEKQPGTVFLFGKTYCNKSKSYVSCCVAVKNIFRQIFLLPRPAILDNEGMPGKEAVTYKDLYCEFASLVAEPMHLKSYKARLVKKKYAFDPTVPSESDYLEVRYSSTEPRINLDSIPTTPKTFSKIFGINTSNIERLLIDAKLKGPCWLDIKNSELNSNPLSWCKIEVNCNSMSNLIKVEENLPPPPLVVATVNFRFHFNTQTNQNEILMASCVSHSRYFLDRPQPSTPFDHHFCVIAPAAKHSLPSDIHESLKSFKATRVQKMDSEKALINYYVIQLSKIDPDLIVGHNLRGYQIDVLANRLTTLNVTSFSQFSRLKRSLKKNLTLEMFTGRLLVDIKISAKELIKARSYDLPTLCQQILKIPENKIIDLDPDEVSRMYATSQDLLKLIGYTMQDTVYMLKMLYDLSVVPLALEITKIAGNVMSRTLMGGRSERNEFLLLHAFNEKGYIVPDKQWKKTTSDEEAKSSKRKPAYTGGLVLEPKVGFYTKLLLLMDFNSLYPSIIQEYNICFTTLPYGESEDEFPDQHLPPGVLPTEIRKLVESRRQVKSLMASPDLSANQRMQYNIRQMALKLTANSMYGCLGFSNSRFYRKQLAALVTEKGRDLLLQTKTLTEANGFEVVYGDTDSIMVNTGITDYQEALKIGQKIKHEVNKSFKCVELDIDGIFKYLLLLKKKKYAAVLLTKSSSGELKTEVEYKGLDIVRRDWSPLASQAGKLVLEQIFTDEKEGEDRFANILSYLKKLHEDLKANKVPLPLLVITKQLTREPHLYAGKEKHPHVQVALRYNKEHGGCFRSGDTVPYVICDDGTVNSHTQRAYHLDELKSKENLKLDSHYYLAHQVHPVITRICEPIEGIDGVVIAECLGLDPTAYKRSAPQKTVDIAASNRTNPLVRYRTCLKFAFSCLKCGTENLVEGPMRGAVPILAKCTNAECATIPLDYLPYIQNQLSMKIRSYITRYYKGKLYCEDPVCTLETCQSPLHFVGKFPVCPACLKGVLFREYTEQQLYSQLEYYTFIFDLERMENKPVLESKLVTAYAQLRETVQKYIKQSAYSIVDWSVFAKLFSTDPSNKGKEKAAMTEMEAKLEKLSFSSDDDFM